MKKVTQKTEPLIIQTPLSTLGLSPLDKLIQSGIPVSQAEFHATVNNADNVPESMFSETSDKMNRRATMWWTSAGLICLQKGKYFVAPPATVRYAHFK